MVDGSSLTRGSGQLRRLADDPGQEYHLYLPGRAVRGDAPIVVSVHGISRNAEEHLRAFAPLAERYGSVIVAPMFSKERFPDYQRLGRDGRGMRADIMLNRIIDDVGRLARIAPRRSFLIGHSGGGQFVHRYVMAHPDLVERYAISAAGWYTLPDSDEPYPLGTGACQALPGVVFDAGAFLAVPGRVFVGHRDIGRGGAVRKSLRLDRDQGRTRLERGRRWCAAMNRAAASRGLPPPISFAELPEAAHRFSGLVRRGGLVEAVFAFLFEAEQWAVH